MHQDLRGLCLRLEGAQGAQNVAICEAHGGAVLRWGSGLGVYYGPGHFMNQGLAMGLHEALTNEEMDRLEAHLAPEGGEVVLELTPGAHLEVSALLHQRGYRIRQFQQVWRMPLAHRPEEPRLEHRLARPGDGFGAVVMAGFMGSDDPGAMDIKGIPSMEGVPGTAAFLSWVDGHPAGGGCVSVFDGVAVLSGTSVLPRFRGRGLQKALIAARLAWAWDQGAREACSATLPGTASQASLERAGYRVAYPKLELVK